MEKLSLDQLFRDHQPFKDEWKLTVIDETDDSVFVMAPNGDTQWLTKDEYESYKNKTK